ncbi:sensor histidine kinase [Dokdonella sp.]|uniref:sensor histidine kinase n=1 Tax=Dokdonella sp. TaxID=2291710 RepID=UPI001B108C90|nr:sensor histidine kinase [Dokdonella sp.]MBO9663223.1 sensor histidine kinase N-terminal domain-containing protein [Dokdonella sp.]
MRADRPPSLRRRLLTILVVPMVLAWLGSGALIYVLALHYANVNYDRSLVEGALMLERMTRSEAGHQELSPQVRILIEYDTDNPTYYAVRSLHHGMLASNLDLPLPPVLPAIGAAPRLDSIRLGKRELRMATLALAQDDTADTVVISMAEALDQRRELAREILIGTSPIVLLLIVVVLVLVWFGVSRGLDLLDPLTQQIAQRRARDLSALDQSQVPVEIRPLTRTIDALFARLRELLELQERFIADAAHQLRTPLAGLRLQAERALADPRPDSVRDALAHVERLSAGAGRAAGQLLALARAQAVGEDDAATCAVDLARLARSYASERVPDALAARIDLGYEGPSDGLVVTGDAVMLREALVNLVDNALSYAGRDGTVTISLAREANAIALAVEDSGPGVAPEWWPRLGERFFRPPDSRREGSGLGLAIVRRIAERHRAEVAFDRGRDGRGLRVTLHFVPLAAA